MDPLSFRTIMGRFATGVTLVTGADGSDTVGATVNAFTALSLAPPQVLVCLDNGSRTLRRILAARSFAVSVLGAGQAELARRFADKSLTAGQRCADLPPRAFRSSAPTIEGAIAAMDCHLIQTWRSGNHTVLVGEVVDGAAEGGEESLIFFAGEYRRLAVP